MRLKKAHTPLPVYVNFCTTRAFGLTDGGTSQMGRLAGFSGSGAGRPADGGGPRHGRRAHDTQPADHAAGDGARGPSFFHRRPTGYDLSAEGEFLLPRAEEIERATLGIWLDRVDPAVGLTGSVRIGTPEAFGTFCLAERLGEFRPRTRACRSNSWRPRGPSACPSEKQIWRSASHVQPPGGSARASSANTNSASTVPPPISPVMVGRRTSRRPASPSLHRLHRHLIFSPELDYFATALPGLQPIIRISNVITQMAAARNGAGLCILPCFMADKYGDLVRPASKLQNHPHLLAAHTCGHVPPDAHQDRLGFYRLGGACCSSLISTLEHLRWGTEIQVRQV